MQPHAAEGASPTLDVITAGPIPPNPTDLLESDRMLEVIAELETRYSVVIIDAPPLAVVPDAVPIANRVSGVLVVVREGKSTSTSVRQLRKQFDNLDITPLGIIVNGASPASKAATTATTATRRRCKVPLPRVVQTVQQQFTSKIRIDRELADPARFALDVVDTNVPIGHPTPVLR